MRRSLALFCLTFGLPALLADSFQPCLLLPFSSARVQVLGVPVSCCSPSVSTTVLRRVPTCFMQTVHFSNAAAVQRRSANKDAISVSWFVFVHLISRCAFIDC